MLKTVCIKTNNKEIIYNLLDEIEYFNLENIIVSCYDFKIYTNIIIHYTGEQIDFFLNKLSVLLSYLIIDFYESKIIQKIINTNYFYFSLDERKEIYSLCLTNRGFMDSVSLINTISKEIFYYFSNNKYLILDGFVAFRLSNYVKELDSIVDMCVNQYIIDKEKKKI